MEAERALQIKAALALLETNNSEHWTADGAPVLEAVGADVLRQEILVVAPLYTRTNRTFDLPPPVNDKRLRAAELAELDAKAEELRLQRAKVVEEQDAELKGTDRKQTSIELSQDIQAYHAQCLKSELLEAQQKEELEAIQRRYMLQASPIDQATAQAVIKQRREQSVHEHERRV